MLWLQNHKDRDEESPVTRELLQNVSTFFVDMGLGKKFYYNNFKKALLADTASYYSQLASRWRMCNSFTVYVQKVTSCTFADNMMQIVHLVYC